MTNATKRKQSIYALIVTFEFEKWRITSGCVHSGSSERNELGCRGVIARTGIRMYEKGRLHVITILPFPPAELPSEKAGTCSEFLKDTKWTRTHKPS